MRWTLNAAFAIQESDNGAQSMPLVAELGNPVALDSLFMVDRLQDKVLPYRKSLPEAI